MTSKQRSPRPERRDEDLSSPITSPAALPSKCPRLTSLRAGEWARHSPGRTEGSSELLPEDELRYIQRVGSEFPMPVILTLRLPSGQSASNIGHRFGTIASPSDVVGGQVGFSDPILPKVTFTNGSHLFQSPQSFTASSWGVVILYSLPQGMPVP